MRNILKDYALIEEGIMEELSKNIKKEDVKDLYETYLKIKSLIEELQKNIKELPPKEEL